MALYTSSLRSLLLTAPRLGGGIKGYVQLSEGESAGRTSEIGTRARSTAEEFARLAEKKADSLRESVKEEKWERAKEAKRGKSKISEKGSVENGKYDEIGG